MFFVESKALAFFLINNGSALSVARLVAFRLRGPNTTGCGSAMSWAEEETQGQVEPLKYFDYMYYVSLRTILALQMRCIATLASTWVAPVGWPPLQFDLIS
jgi:hypothetical protein